MKVQMESLAAEGVPDSQHAKRESGHLPTSLTLTVELEGVSVFPPMPRCWHMLVLVGHLHQHKQPASAQAAACHSWCVTSVVSSSGGWPGLAQTSCMRMNVST